MPRELPHEGTINCIDTDPIGYSEERGLESVSLTIGGERPLNPFNKLLDAARAELKTAGEQTDLEILEAIPNDGRLEKFFSPSLRESDSVTARENGQMERASHGTEGLFRS
jgi:hypothetical protein